MPTATADLKIQATDNTTVEHAQIQIGGDKPGAPAFRINLLVNGPFVTGVGTITQATNPPVNIHTFLTGRTSLIVFGGNVTRVIQLTGHENPTPLPPNPINVQQVDIVLDGLEGTRGSGHYQYLRNDQFQQAEGPATATWSKAHA
jgi:Domain of unknown function (DUF1842)